MSSEQISRKLIGSRRETFTSGPWEVRVTPRYGEYNHREIADENGVIAEVYSGEDADTPTDAEAAAIAHLISAAPELYEAAQEALSFFEATGLGESRAKLLRVALAKARGQS